MSNPVFDVVSLPVGQMAANCYIVSDKKTGETVIIDPGDDAQYLIDEIQKRLLRPTFVVATHGHFDHIMGVAEVHSAFGIPFLIHTEDEFLLKTISDSVRHFLGKNISVIQPSVSGNVMEGSSIVLGENTLTCIEVPGHTPGSIAIVSDDDHIMFVGDTIFSAGSVGRTDFSYSDKQSLLQSIQRILTYPGQTRLFPGHGESTTVALERSFHDAIIS